MLEIRKSEDHGAAEHGWLGSRHSFSFADHYDRERTGFGPLNVGKACSGEPPLRGGRAPRPKRHGQHRKRHA